MKNEEASNQIEEAKGLVISSIAETMDLYGVTPSVGRLYGIMYFQHEPMTLDEMKDELGMSKPSMSTAVKKLQDNEMVQKSWIKGSRRDMFIAEKDFFKSFSQFFCKKWEKEVVVNLEASINAEEMLEKIINNDDIDEGIREEAKVYYEQINESKYYYNWLKHLVDSFKSGDIYKCIPKDNDE